MKNILITIPIRNRDWCIQKVLDSICAQDYPLEKLGLYFILNDSTDKTEKILTEFKANKFRLFQEITIDRRDFGAKEGELKEHNWTTEAFDRIAELRNRCLTHERMTHNYDYLLMLDSDVVLHPHVISRLVETDKDIICENSWSTWGHRLSDPLPHVTDELPQFFPKMRGWITTIDMIEKLKKPGLYKLTPNKQLRVGTCMLLNRKFLDAKPGVDFSIRADNWDEQLSFCTAAQELGFDIWMDTTCENLSAEKYGVVDFWTQVSHDLYTKAIKIMHKEGVCESSYILDVGCGVGYGASLLDSCGAGFKVMGLDSDPRCAELAQLNSGIKVIERDFLKYDGNYVDDVIICFEVIEHVLYIERFLAALKRNLKPGAMFFLSTPNSELWKSQPEFHIHRFTQEVFENMMKENFPNVEFDHLFMKVGTEEKLCNFVAYGRAE